MESPTVFGSGGAFCATAGTEQASRMPAAIARIAIARIKECKRCDIKPSDHRDFQITERQTKKTLQRILFRQKNGKHRPTAAGSNAAAQSDVAAVLLHNFA